VHWQLIDPPRLLRLAQRLQASGVKRFAVQIVRTATMLDAQLACAPIQTALPELWARMRELFPAFVLRG